MTLANPRKIIGAYMQPAHTQNAGIADNLPSWTRAGAYPASPQSTTTQTAPPTSVGIRNPFSGGVTPASAFGGGTVPKTAFGGGNLPTSGVRPAPQMIPAHAPGAVLTPQTGSTFRGQAAFVASQEARPTAGPSAEAQRLNGLSRMSDGTFPGQAAFMASQGVRNVNPLGGGTVTAPPAKRGVRRAAPAAWSPSSAGYEQEAPTPVETAAPQVQVGPTPMVQELPVQGAEFDSQNAEIPGANGGFGLTRNADGTVDQMFSLRQRTAAEDAANPRQTSEAYPPAPAGIRLRPGDLGYTGSQQAWEDEQDANRIASRPFGFKMAAAQLAQRAQGETEANNMRKFGLDSAQTAANVQHLGTEDQKISTEIPWIGPTAAAGVRQTLASADNLSANASKTSEETKYVGPQAQAEIQYKKDAGLGIRSGAAVSQAMLPWNIDNIKSEIGLRAKAGEAQLTKAEQASAKNEEIKYTNASKAYDTFLNQNPGDVAGAQAAYAAQLRAYDAAKAGEVPIVTPAEKGSKGFLGIGRKEAKPSTITYVPKAKAAKTLVATATDAQGQKWVKYADGSIAKAE